MFIIFLVVPCKGFFMFLRILTLIFCIQKAFDFLFACFPTILNFSLETFGIEKLNFDNLSLLLLRLWASASLAWSYFLFRAFLSPKKHMAVIDGTIIGFIGAGLAAVLTKTVPDIPAAVQMFFGIFLIVEGIILFIARTKSIFKKK